MRVNNIFRLIKNKVKKNKNLDLILRFDIFNKKIQIARVNSQNDFEISIKEFFYKSSFISDKFINEINLILTEFMAEYPLVTANCFVILPDNSVTLHTIINPQISGVSQQKAYLASIENEYDIKNNVIKYYVLSKSKKTLTYCIASVNKKLVSNIITGLKRANCVCKTITFNSNCITNYITNSSLNLKRKNLLLINVGKNNSTYIAINNGKIMAFSQLYFGYEKIIDSKTYQNEFNCFIKWANIFSQNLSFLYNLKIDEIVFNIPKKFAYLVDNEKTNNKKSNSNFSVFYTEKNYISLLGAFNFNSEFNFYEKI